MSFIKHQLYQECERYLNERIEVLNAVIKDLKNSLESETKSSAGDKHETGRAMVQLELEKSGRQYQAIQKQQQLLTKTNINDSSPVVRLGSLIETSNGIYFIAISKGLVTLNNQPYFVIAPQSPIGKLLLGKQKGDEFIFNGKSVLIQSIV